MRATQKRERTSTSSKPPEGILRDELHKCSTALGAQSLRGGGAPFWADFMRSSGLNGGGGGGGGGKAASSGPRRLLLKDLPTYPFCRTRDTHRKTREKNARNKRSKNELCIKIWKGPARIYSHRQGFVHVCLRLAFVCECFHTAVSSSSPFLFCSRPRREF